MDGRTASLIHSAVQVCLAIVYCFVSAGIVFGFAALKPVLVSENVYRNYCSLEELAQNVPVCDGQEIRYVSGRVSSSSSSYHAHLYTKA